MLRAMPRSGTSSSCSGRTTRTSSEQTIFSVSATRARTSFPPMWMRSFDWVMPSRVESPPPRTIPVIWSRATFWGEEEVTIVWVDWSDRTRCRCRCYLAGIPPQPIHFAPGVRGELGNASQTTLPRSLPQEGPRDRRTGVYSSGGVSRSLMAPKSWAVG